MLLWESAYREYQGDEKEIIELNKIKERFERAYEVLVSDKDREQYNEYLDMKQKEEEDKKREEENKNAYDCIDMYDQTLIKRVSYRRNTRNIDFDPYTFEDEKNFRKVSCKLLGFISYSTEVRDVRYELARYEVEAISTQNPETRKYKVITPIINYSELCDNSRYRNAIYTKLFSEENLESSDKRNYEYLGRIIEMNREYNLEYNQKEFCTATKFSTSGLKNRVDNPRKRKKTLGSFVKKIKENIKQKEGEER